jgi:hypothetical protein
MLAARARLLAGRLASWAAPRCCASSCSGLVCRRALAPRQRAPPAKMAAGGPWPRHEAPAAAGAPRTSRGIHNLSICTISMAEPAHHSRSLCALLRGGPQAGHGRVAPSQGKIIVRAELKAVCMCPLHRFGPGGGATPSGSATGKGRRQFVTPATSKRFKPPTRAEASSLFLARGPFSLAGKSNIGPPRASICGTHFVGAELLPLHFIGSPLHIACCAAAFVAICSCYKGPLLSPPTDEPFNALLAISCSSAAISLLRPAASPPRCPRPLRRSSGAAR